MTGTRVARVGASGTTGREVGGHIPLANLVLAGPGRAGTTSLFWYLAQHPQICHSSIKETHYFMPLSEVEDGASGRLPPASDYGRYFRRFAGEPYLMEASPRYFQGGRRLVCGLRSMLPGVSVMVTLRDPVLRTWSMYRYVRSHGFIAAGETFDRYVDRCEALARSGARQSADNRPYWGTRVSRYADHLPAWLEELPPERLQIVFFEDMVADVPGTLERLCGWLGLDAGDVGDWDLSVRNTSGEVRSAMLHRVARFANHERLLRNHRRLKSPLRRAYYAVNRGREETMPADTRRRLEAIFRQPNRRLCGQLAASGYRDLPPWLSTGEPMRRPAADGSAGVSGTTGRPNPAR
ncbi:MAG TPA: sulfotransferase [Gaiellales bacterium]|nr:sulfotransferase [Gaiellales bacterium]